MIINDEGNFLIEIVWILFMIKNNDLISKKDSKEKNIKQIKVDSPIKVADKQRFNQLLDDAILGIPKKSAD